MELKRGISPDPYPKVCLKQAALKNEKKYDTATFAAMRDHFCCCAVAAAAAAFAAYLCITVIQTKIESPWHPAFCPAVQQSRGKERPAVKPETRVYRPVHAAAPSIEKVRETASRQHTAGQHTARNQLNVNTKPHNKYEEPVAPLV